MIYAKKYKYKYSSITNCMDAGLAMVESLEGGGMHIIPQNIYKYIGFMIL